MPRGDGEGWAGDGYWFDPGHPGGLGYLGDLATDLGRRYDRDGLALDRLPSLPDQAAWLDQWLAWERGHSYGRQVIAGLGIYLNTPADSIAQVRRALAAGPDGSRLAGVALYSYASPDASRANADPGDDSPDGFMWDVLTRPAPENDFAPPFAEPVAAPR